MKPKKIKTGSPLDELFQGMPGHVMDVKNRFKNLQRATDRKKFMDRVAMNSGAPGTQHRA